MKQSDPSSCYQRETPMFRRAKRHVIKVYGPPDPTQAERREAQGWQPNQPHRRPSSAIQTSVKSKLKG